MEELRQAAEDYYRSASEEYKQGFLDSGESFLEFYVCETKRSIRQCDACRTLLPGYYFCCVDCERNNTSFSLCINCFDKGKFQHQHDSFADNHSVLTMHNKGNNSLPPCVIEKKREGEVDQLLQPPVQQTKELVSMTTVIKDEMGKEAMKKLAQIAEAHYNAAPEAIRKMADDFFWSMVKKGNNSVKQDDFLASMKKMGYTEYAKPEFFQLLLKDGNQDDLSILEGRTLFYILVSRRPFCSCCNCFIPDIFFCCSKCPATTYSLCLHCYTAKEYVRHNHYGDHDAFFLDYTVLHNCIQTSPTKPKKQKTGLKIGKLVKFVSPYASKDTLSTITAILGAWAATLTIGSTCCTIM
nr:uncharacterized protein LOC109158156 isoform X2 [Ipomoea trifida]GMD03636.1 Ca2+ sensor (EF-Hand superfamily) [Ipomoea batatas]